MTAQLLWILSAFLALWSADLLCSGLPWRDLLWGFRRNQRLLSRVSRVLQDFEESLGAGMAPSSSQWESLLSLATPWGELIHSSVHALRTRGSSVIPTLRRLRGLADYQRESLQEARSRSAQALAQSLVASMLVPLMGAALYALLPALAQRPCAWLAVLLLGILLSAAGALWMLQISDAARWGGVSKRARPWVLASLCSGEKFLALLRSGCAPEKAWTLVCSDLGHSHAELASLWGAALWAEPVGKYKVPPGAQALVELGSEIRKAVQVSLMEGRSCGDRVEGALESLRLDLRAAINRELSLLGARALKPLFLCVAPALLGLLFAALYMSWAESGGLL